jgi:hypothetical protein
MEYQQQREGQLRKLMKLARKVSFFPKGNETWVHIHQM